MDKLYSIVALRVSVCFSLSNNVLPYNRVCNKEELVNSSTLQSVLFRVLKKVYCSSLNVGQWRRKCEVDYISTPQLQIGFKNSWKLCLNFCWRKSLTPTHSCVVSLIPLWLSQLKSLLGEGLINFKILFLKTTTFFEFHRVGSKLFHSIIVEAREEFLKKLHLILEQGILLTFLVVYSWVFSGISLKRY